MWDNKGHIVTNYHVVQRAAEVQVALVDQTVCMAKVPGCALHHCIKSVWCNMKPQFVGADPEKDIAVLKLDCSAAQAAQLKPVTLGTSDPLFVGQKVCCTTTRASSCHTATTDLCHRGMCSAVQCVQQMQLIAENNNTLLNVDLELTSSRSVFATRFPQNPFGLDHTLTQGVISGLNRELPTGGRTPIKDVIQTDAAINPGNSGGVLLDSKGRVIGVNTAIADPTGKGASAGVGFAIPIDTVKPLVEQILTHGRVIRPVLGIAIAPPQTLRQLGVEGVLIMDVSPDGPAAKAGTVESV